jgi:hypothetical protein
MLAKLRFKLALLVDRLDRRQRYCWADICTGLGLGWNVWGWRAEARSSMRQCFKDCDELGTCWCGKLRQSDAHVTAIWAERAKARG